MNLGGRRSGLFLKYFAFIVLLVSVGLIASGAIGLYFSYQETRNSLVSLQRVGEDDVRAGLLLSYWIVHSDPPGRVAMLVDKILRGADPGKIPFELPDKTSFALNRGTAKAIGLRVPDEILVRATEVFG
jgi:ABC-type uncharacterized transport system substrate-binding protein